MTWQRLWLIWQFARRDVLSRYRGSTLGIAWSALQPLAFLATYVFVFAYVLAARWPGAAPSSGLLDFGLVIFAGLIVHGMVSESLARAPGLIREQPHLVTKVAFPLQWLPVSALATALFQTAISLLVLAAVTVFAQGALPKSALLAPLALLPLAIGTLGAMWFVAALGVFLRDTHQIVTPLLALLLFLSPIFWPLEALSPTVRPWFEANPLSLPIAWVRATMLGLGRIEWSEWFVYLLIALMVAALGRAFFVRLARGFADEL